MIRKCQVIFCDNEHGNGEQTFPDLSAIKLDELELLFIEGQSSLGVLRKAAKVAGWGRVDGVDYCPLCMGNDA